VLTVLLTQQLSLIILCLNFSKSCSSNNATAASQLKSTYDEMIMDYCGSWMGNTCKFDAELVQNEEG